MKYLLDSNIIIYSIEPGYQYLRDFLKNQNFCASIISKIEVLGYHKITFDEKENFSKIFNALELLPIDENIIEQFIALRQQKNILLGDSLIAATAIIHNNTLLTANEVDFKWVPNLKVNNPIK